MIKKIRELQEERNRAINEARKVLDDAGDNIAQAELDKFEAVHKRADEISAKIKLLERQANLERSTAAVESVVEKVPELLDERSKFGAFLRTGDRKQQILTQTTDDGRAFIESFSKRSKNHYENIVRALIDAIQNRGLTVGSSVDGGYLKTQETLIGEFITAVKDVTYMREICRVLPPITSQAGVTPSLDTDPADADWSTEISTINEDTAIKFGYRKLEPHALSKLIKISKDLIDAEGMDAVAIVNERAAYKFGITEEKGFLTGSGFGQPLGVFTSSALGVTTARDVSTGNTTTAIKADNLKAVKWNLKAQYLRNSNWIFHRDGMLQINQLKDGDGQYLLKTGIAEDGGDILLGRPVKISEYAPNTFTTGLRVGILGDFSHYWILDNANTTVQVLLELYAATNQNGYIWRRRTDGQPVLAEAFSVVKLA